MYTQEKNSVKNFFIMALPTLIMVTPNLKLPIDAVPIYISLLVIGSLWVYYYSVQAKHKVDPQILRMVIIYFLLTAISALFEMLRYKQVLQSGYMLAQYCLSFSLLFTLPKLITSAEDLRLLFKWVFIGLVINSVICIGFALPSTGGYFQNYLFSKSWLYPAKSRLLGYLEIDRENTARTFRGQTLFGNANVAGSIVLEGIIMTFAYFQFLKVKKPSDGLVLTGTIVAAVVALVLTQSRSAYLAAILVLLYLFITRAGRKVRKYFVLAGITTIIVFALKSGNESSNIKFDRVTNTLNMLSGDEELGYSEEARILSYTKFFTYLIDYPQFWIYGRGIANSAIARYHGVNVNQEFSLKGGLNHFYFASVFYERGFLAAIVFTILLFFILKKTILRPPQAFKNSTLLPTSQMLILSLLIPLLVTHYFTEDAQGSFLLFFIIGVSLLAPQIKSQPTVKTTIS